MPVFALASFVWLRRKKDNLANTKTFDSRSEDCPKKRESEEAVGENGSKA
jgi:hypothetical protein